MLVIPAKAGIQVSVAKAKMGYRPLLRPALRAIGSADVRFGILPSHSGLRRNDENTRLIRGSFGVNGLNDYFLQSKRLGLRLWDSADLPLALRLWANPVVTRLISTQPLTADDVRLRLDREMETQATHGMQYWPVFLLGSDDFVGCCGLRPRAQEPGVPEFGVHLLPEYWRHGYAAEAASLVFAHAFHTLGFRALFAGHNPNNAASRALLLRLGFARTHDEFYPPTGLMHPSYRLAKDRGHAQHQA